MKVKFILSFLVLMAYVLLPSVSFAQGDPGTDPDVPIDGGLSVLLAAGVAYGMKKAYSLRKKNRAADHMNEADQ